MSTSPRQTSTPPTLSRFESFAVKNLTAEDLVTLSGAHSLGSAHCTVFTERIYPFSRDSETDPTLNPGFAALLRTACPDNTTEASVYLDLLTPKVLDNMGFGLLGSDQALTGEPRLAAAVGVYAQSSETWVANFTAAMVKLGNILELTGEEGEIRTNCRVVNTDRQYYHRLVARSR
ncbi:hypothetical protein Taro_018006 [Colocasia esculenta]|uniref:Plant heme peroxidase family profile domain-containing protein n=1 Tax=Colocasia esculenta TaxID=4460 RepID=A0A843V159_COLES|nr:hypothetical protein [Colocasia esculenta]